MYVWNRFIHIYYFPTAIIIINRGLLLGKQHNRNRFQDAQFGHGGGLRGKVLKLRRPGTKQFLDPREVVREQ